MSASGRSGGFWFVCFLAFALFVLHQDVWFWADARLVLGFVPIGLFYHALFSLACGVTWALAVRFCWPDRIEEWADEAAVSGDAGERP